MSKMDLDQDYQINGRLFKKGKDVDVSAVEPVFSSTGRPVEDSNGKAKTHTVDYSDAIKEMQKDGAASSEFVNTHHGAVPAPDDPQEATAQTPTRPLAAPNVRVNQVFRPATQDGPVIEVLDPSADGKGRSASDTNMDVVEDKEGEIIAGGTNEDGTPKLIDEVEPTTSKSDSKSDSK